MIPYRTDPTPASDPPFTKPPRKPWRLPAAIAWLWPEDRVLRVLNVVLALCLSFVLFRGAVLVQEVVEVIRHPERQSLSYHVTLPPGYCLYAQAPNTYLVLPCAP